RGWGLGGLEARKGDGEVVVRLGRRPDQPLEGLVLEDHPPRLIAKRSGAGGGRGIEAAVQRWERDFGPLVVGPDGTRREATQRQREQENAPHGCSPRKAAAEPAPRGTGSLTSPFPRLARRPRC